MPGLPELVSRMDPGLSTARVSVLVGSFWLTRVTFGAVIRTVWLFVPDPLYLATCVAPVQATFALVQLKPPVREMPTVAPDHVPGPTTIVPRSRFSNHLSANALTP